MGGILEKVAIGLAMYCLDEEVKEETNHGSLPNFWLEQ